MIASIVLAGCGRSRLPPPLTPPKSEPEPTTVVTGKGEYTRLEAFDLWWIHENLPSWSIRWERAKLGYSTDQDFGGKMEAVTGTIFQNGEPMSDYSAEFGEVDKKTQLLTIYGNVKVTSRNEPKAEMNPASQDEKRLSGVLTCDRLEWLPSRGLVAAKGNVRFASKTYQAGTLKELSTWQVATFKELWATPNIGAPGGTIGTPDQFADWEGLTKERSGK